jgi:hypothetical protein
MHLADGPLSKLELKSYWSNFRRRGDRVSVKWDRSGAKEVEMHFERDKISRAEIEQEKDFEIRIDTLRVMYTK